jgi:hypothetical protein
MEPIVSRAWSWGEIWRRTPGRPRRRPRTSEDAILLFGFALGLIAAAGLMLVAFGLGVAVGSAATGLHAV